MEEQGHPTTSRHLARLMADQAELGPGMRVLEPSCGVGVLANEARGRGCYVDCIEKEPTLVELTRAQGFYVHEADFLSLMPGPYFGEYDRVLMNPPFAFERDVKHVVHAFDFLRDGGVLVSCIQQLYTFSPRWQYRLFRDWLRRWDHRVGVVQDSEISPRFRRTVIQLRKVAMPAEEVLDRSP